MYLGSSLRNGRFNAENPKRFEDAKRIREPAGDQSKDVILS